MIQREAPINAAVFAAAFLLIVAVASPADARRLRLPSGSPDVVESAQGDAYLQVEMPEFSLEDDEQIAEILLVIEMPEASGLSCMSVIPFDAATVTIPSGPWSLTGPQRAFARTRCAGSRVNGVLRLRVPVGEIVTNARAETLTAPLLVIGLAAGDGLIEGLPGEAVASLESLGDVWSLVFDALIVSKED